ESREEYETEPSEQADDHIAAHQGVPKSTVEKAHPRDEHLRPKATHVRLEREIEDPHETGHEKRYAESQDEQADFALFGHMMRLKNQVQPRGRENCDSEPERSPSVSPP